MQATLPFERIDRAERFRQFHQANPHVYVHLLRYAREMRPCTKRYGIRGIWERMRWGNAVGEIDGDEEDYKLNDHYTAFYARLLIRDYPDEFLGWLETRGKSELPDGV